MNILIIGNGFDIAHGLPTRYKDFLETCVFAKKASVIWNDDKSDVTVTGLKGAKQQKKYKSFCLTMGHPLCERFHGLAKNFWTSYFQERMVRSGENWIDFEEEIKNVVERVYQDTDGITDDKVDIAQISNDILKRYCKSQNFIGKRSYKDLYAFLLEENRKLIRCLELYMDGYVNSINVSLIPYISSKRIDKVLSFNYTVTYTENYNASVDCCYIHGRADANRYAQNCNLVLGYDDHYIDGVKAIHELIPFEKYYQRIVNRNDNQYFDWLEEIKKESENNIFIYGHSLGQTDGDVLKAFILSDNVHVKIFYYNETDRAEKIKNLAVVLGPDNLIKLTGGSNPVIEFETSR